MKIFNFVLGFGLGSVFAIAPSMVIAAENPLHSQLFLASEPLIQQSRQLYESGQFLAAAQLLQQAADEFETKGDFQNQAIALSNLSLAYQKLGQWQEAIQAIDTSLTLLQGSRINTPEILAQTLQIKGQFFLATGQPQEALDAWKQATQVYEKAGNETGAIASRINQAEALQSIGLYRTALDRLKEVLTRLEEQPDSLLKARAFLSLGNTLRVSGSLGKKEALPADLDVEQALPASVKAIDLSPENVGAIDALVKSWEIAKTLNHPQMVAEAYLSLGNTYQTLAQNSNELKDIEGAQKSINIALWFYEKAAQIPEVYPTTRIDAQLNALNILIAKGDWSKVEALQGEIAAQIDSFPPSRQSVFARVNLAKQFIELWQKQQELAEVGMTQKFDRDAAELLRTAVHQARQLKDLRAESFALGTLGTLYEQKKQWQYAQQTTEKALLISQSIQAGDIAYQWQWQLGRVLEQQDKKKEAIAAYDSSVKTLSSIRSDLAATTPDLQFSFREDVEPIYRELVELLLTTESSPSQENLKLARQTIEALQLAELDNFFREACIEAEEKEIDEIDSNAAVIYSIVVKNRLEVIASFPKKDSDNPDSEQTLRHYSHVMEGNNANSAIEALQPQIFRGMLTRSGAIEAYIKDPLNREELLTPARQFYDWLIRPIETDLENNQTKTLVFVLDGALRSIPMSMLHDGEKYLIEKYAIALTPGLQLLEANPLTPAQLPTLAAGLSEERFEFPALPNVETELTEINELVGGIKRLNGEFERANFQTDLNTIPFSVVHLATHGQFSSNREETFVLASDGKINVDTLTTLIQSREEGRRTAIELLVLSACQTAAGDDRATLGLAGFAVRAGARSTIASLWLVDDASTAELMSRFYQYLKDPNKTKVQAFREAQLSLLRDAGHEEWHHPSHWAAFVLVGNWN